ncbi:MAG: trypsin-like serine protease [Granulosicoccus sp.]
MRALPGLKLASAGAICALASAFGINALANEPENRIVGGEQIAISEAPSTVALLLRARVELDANLYQAQFCGGTLIDSRWILTAAHCMVDALGQPRAANSVMALMESADLANPVSQPVDIAQVIVHEAFVKPIEGSDIALLRLVSDAMVPTTALDSREISPDDQGLVVGWGALNAGGSGSAQEFPSKIRGAVIRMLSGDRCAELYSDYSGLTDETNICGGLADGGIDACQGDSGGPLYRVSEESGRPVSITGITSWGVGCGDASFPGVYTRVGSYIDWIVENTGSDTIATDGAPRRPDNAITVDGSTISWPGKDWHQVLNGETFEPVCNGGNSCTVAAGSYLVINHDTGQRYENIIVDIDPSIINVSGQTISWPDDGWYQVLNADDFRSVCQGGSSCVALPGVSVVIAATTGQRFEDVRVGEDRSSLTVGNNSISWSDDGWYQVLSAATSQPVCNGGSSCDVASGSYIVINHSTGQRFEDIVVERDPGAVSVNGQTISWLGTGWHQVLDAQSFETVCDGQPECDVLPGTYVVIDHSTGERYENIVVEVDANAVRVDGNTITWTQDGWHQVLNAVSFEAVCNGGESCAVSPGTYIVINHSTGQRYEDIIIGTN